MVLKDSEPFRVAECIRESSIEFLCVLNHLIERRLTLVDQLVELAQLAVLHLNVETGSLSFSLQLCNLFIELRNSHPVLHQRLVHLVSTLLQLVDFSFELVEVVAAAVFHLNYF